MIETNNILSTPTGPEYQLLVGEGQHRHLIVDGNTDETWQGHTCLKRIYT